MKGFGDLYKDKKKRNKKDQISTKQLVNQAIQSHLRGNIEEATKYYQQLINRGFDNPSIFSNYGIILKNLGKLQEAEFYTRKAIELNPDFADAYSNLGSILKNLGKLQEAEFYTRKAIELKPDFADAYSNLGSILKDLGQLQEAEFYTRKAIELKPDFAGTHYNLGNIFKDLGQLQEAELYTRKAIELKPDFANAYSNLGSILKDLGQLQEAELYTRKAIELKPDFANAHSNLGNILKDLGQLQEAEFYTRKAIELKPDFANAHSNLGTILKDLGQLQEAEFYTRKAIELKPDFANAHSNLGTILKDLGQLQEAELYTRKAIELKPDFAEAHLNLGSILKNLGKLQEAEFCIRKAIEINPKLAKAYFVLSTFDISTGKKDWEKYLFAEDILKNQSELENIDTYFARANILEKKLNYKQAANMLKKANKLNRKVYGSNYMEQTNEMKKYFRIWRSIKNNQDQEANPLTTIFVVGLPRSGKTITESILALNKKLLKCGEDNALSIAINKYLNQGRAHNNQNLYQLFIESITKKISNKSFICLTRPNNYIYTGLIASHIKNSKVIFCYRNPLDNIKEMYRYNLGNKYTFKTSLIESAKILLSINELMREYKKIFNSKIYFLNYDQLVLNQEKEIKSLVNWLGWEYKQKYLYPTLDSTTTINSFNNDSLINTKHLNTWKNYQELLKPAIETIHSKNKFSKLISSI
jgi:tetratricopeptide (TPR) repeat protein